jgi:two-component system, OmpR family, response regulator
MKKHVLKDLFEHSGEVRSTTDLMRAAHITVQPNTIVVHIKAIREEIQKMAPEFSAWWRAIIRPATAR